MENIAWRLKFRAFLLNFSVSASFASLAAILFFVFWYPSPFDEISGGRNLFLLLVSVDVILGPLITMIVFNPKKSRREKLLDFGVIVALQVCAFIYGLWMASQARPVEIVFEYDRLRVVHASEVPKEFLEKAPNSFKNLPWNGPGFMSLRPMRQDEQIDRTLLALGGVALSAQADLWQPYEKEYEAIIQNSRPASDLFKRFPENTIKIEKALENTNLSINELRYIPLVSRSDKFWTAIISSADAKAVAYLPLDPF